MASSTSSSANAGPIDPDLIQITCRINIRLVVWILLDHILLKARRNGQNHSLALFFSCRYGPPSNCPSITFRAHIILIPACPDNFSTYNYWVHIVGILEPYRHPPENTMASNHGNAAKWTRKYDWAWVFVVISFSLSMQMAPHCQSCPAKCLLLINDHVNSFISFRTWGFKRIFVWRSDWIVMLSMTIVMSC